MTQPMLIYTKHTKKELMTYRLIESYMKKTKIRKIHNWINKKKDYNY